MSPTKAPGCRGSPNHSDEENHLAYYAIQWIQNYNNGAVQRLDDFSQAGNLLANKVNTIVNIFSDAPHIEEVAKQAERKRNIILSVVQGVALLIAPTTEPI